MEEDQLFDNLDADQPFLSQDNPMKLDNLTLMFMVIVCMVGFVSFMGGEPVLQERRLMVDHKTAYSTALMEYKKWQEIVLNY